MRVHHINLCTMCPFGGRLLTGEGSIFDPGELVIHALVAETKDGLVLVDTGFGLADLRDAVKRLGRGFLLGCRPRLREEDTAIRQIEALGFSKKDVRHIVVTHLDVDHAGGIADFPDAKVHVHRREQEAALARTTFLEKERYRSAHWAHGPDWALHEEGGDKWFGFESAKAVGDDVVLVPLFGHTRGHCAVAVRAPEGSGVEWLMHCGDAYFFHGQLGASPSCPPALAGFQRLMAVENDKRIANVERLRELYRDKGSRVRMFSAHCPFEWRAITAASARAVREEHELRADHQAASK